MYISMLFSSYTYHYGLKMFLSDCLARILRLIFGVPSDNNPVEHCLISMIDRFMLYIQTERAYSIKDLKLECFA